MPDSIWSEAIIRRLSTDPCVAWATATRPETPQLPPCSHGGEAAGLEMALASTPPISKKLPAVAAAPMRKKGISCALPGAARPTIASTATTAHAKHRPERRNSESIVSPGETATSENNTDHLGLQSCGAWSGQSNRAARQPRARPALWPGPYLLRAT